MAARRLTITGLVQGVFFRVEAKKKADELGLTGWVRNHDADGSVEIHAEGPENTLKELERWCWKGPPKAVVKNVEFAMALEKPYTSFDIWY